MNKRKKKIIRSEMRMRAPSTATAATTTVTLTAIKTKEKSITKDERRRLDSEWLKMMQQRKI